MLDLSIELAEAIPKAISLLLSLLGRDKLSNEFRARLEELVALNVREASFIQCLGMNRPIPLATVYRPSRFRTNEYSSRGANFEVGDVLRAYSSAIVWGAPGAGKSTFLKRAYLDMLEDPSCAPIMLLLRQPSAITDLTAIVETMRTKVRSLPEGKRLVLLLDGYDEIPTDARKRVAELLKLFVSRGFGFFLMTCRLHYELIDIGGRYFWIDEFKPEDSIAYVDALNRVYSTKIDSKMLVEELANRGFGDFLRNPLLLTLVCILKAGPLPSLPTNTIGLVERALATLTFRWDESKGISRANPHALDGMDRLRCLSRIAFEFDRPVGLEILALREAETFLRLKHRQDINAREMLLECAQWYGVFVPTSDARWEFTHRTMHDYLAAKHWVESGRFAKVMHGLKEPDFDARTAYAACLCDDATPVLTSCLALARDASTFYECISNGVAFDEKKVATAFAARFANPKLHPSVDHSRIGPLLTLKAPGHILATAPEALVLAILEGGRAGIGRPGHEIAYGVALHEAHKRGLSLKTSAQSIKISRVSLTIGSESPVELAAA